MGINFNNSLCIVVLCAAGIMASGCATEVRGTTETVDVKTDPVGATCEFMRGGEVLGSLVSTPGKYELRRHNEPVRVTCSLEGYTPKTKTLNSEFAGATFGNILLGGVIGVVVDAASGANNEYPDEVDMMLVPASSRPKRIAMPSLPAIETTWSRNIARQLPRPMSLVVPKPGHVRKARAFAQTTKNCCWKNETRNCRQLNCSVPRPKSHSTMRVRVQMSASTFL